MADEESIVEELAAEFLKDLDKSIAEARIDVTTNYGIAIRNWIIAQVRITGEAGSDDPAVVMDEFRGLSMRCKAYLQKSVVNDGQSHEPAA